MWRVVCDNKYKIGDIIMFTSSAFVDHWTPKKVKEHFKDSILSHGTEECPWIGEVMSIFHNKLVVKMDDTFHVCVYTNKVWSPDVVDDNGEEMIEYDIPPEE